MFFKNGKGHHGFFRMEIDDNIEYQMGVGISKGRGVTIIDFQTY